MLNFHFIEPIFVGGVLTAVRFFADKAGERFESKDAAVGIGLHLLNMGARSEEEIRPQIVRLKNEQDHFAKYARAMAARSGVSDQFRLPGLAKSLLNAQEPQSIECLRRVVSLPKGEIQQIVFDLTRDELDGRGFGETGGHQAFALLLKRAKRIASVYQETQVLTQNFTAKNPFTGQVKEGNNLFVVTGRSMAPRVICSAHYDHLSLSWLRGYEFNEVKTIRFSPASISPYLNGAADNACAVAALFSVLRACAEAKVPAAFAFFDGEEADLLGSQHFAGAEKLFPVADLRLLINVDILGLDIFPGFETKLNVLGASTGGTELQQDVFDAFSATGLEVTQLGPAFGYKRSDHESFRRFKLPMVFISDGDGSHYHTSADEFEQVNFNKVDQAAEGIWSLVQRSVKGPTSPYSYQGVTYLNDLGVGGILTQSLLSSLTTVNNLDRSVPGVNLRVPSPTVQDLEALKEILKCFVDGLGRSNVIEKSEAKQVLECDIRQLDQLKDQLAGINRFSLRVLPVLNQITAIYSRTIGFSKEHAGVPKVELADIRRKSIQRSRRGL